MLAIVLLSACSAAPEAADRPIKPLITQDAVEKARANLPPDIGDGTHVVVARGAALYADSARTQQVFQVSQKENVVFELGDIRGGSVQVKTRTRVDGSCHHGADGFEKMDLSFWVGFEALVPVVAKDIDLGERNGWSVVAHPGAEFIDGQVVYANTVWPAADAEVASSFTPRKRNRGFGRLDKLDTPFPVGSFIAWKDASGKKSSYYSVDGMTHADGRVFIDEACFTLSRPDDSDVVDTLGIGGLMGSLIGAQPVIVPKHTGVALRDGTKIGQTVDDVSIYNAFREGELLCESRTFPMDSNMMGDTYVLCFEMP